MQKAIHEIGQCAEKYDLTFLDIALGYFELCDMRVHPIFGGRTLEQFLDMISTVGSLDSTKLHKINTVFSDFEAITSYTSDVFPFNAFER